MKHFTLCLALVGASVPVCAQAPIGSRALSSATVARQDWPSYSRVAHSKPYFRVEALQLLLRNGGVYKSTPDGVFGPATERSVKAFQRSKGLKVDGVVGAQTWGKLCPRLKRGDRGDAVRALQLLISVKTDGFFGSGTEKALRKEQRNFNLKADGVVAAQTWAMLLSPQEADDAMGS